MFESVLGGEIFIFFAGKLWTIVRMAYLWYAKAGEVGLGLADDCGCECILKFIDFYPIREVADSYQVIRLLMGTDVLAHYLPWLCWNWQGFHRFFR